MFNDLPENLKKEVRSQYYIRLCIVAGLLLLLVHIVSMFFIFPSWILSTVKKQELESTLFALTESEKTVHDASTSESISSTNKILRTLNTTFQYPHTFPFFNTILSFKKPGIQLSKFSYSSKSATDAAISLEGIASTREILVSFVKDLKSSGAFTAVDLPVSNLAKDTNIDFLINITISKKS